MPDLNGVISQTVLDYMKEHGLEFSDFEKAAIISTAGIPVYERRERLEKLSSETGDESLKAQIRAYLDDEGQDLDAFFKNTEGLFYAVQAVWPEEDATCGYFANAEMAHAHGMRQGCGFETGKYMIVGLNGQEANL